jgi:hypothetical protein
MSRWGVESDVIVEGWYGIYVAILGGNKRVGTLEARSFGFGEEKFARAAVCEGSEQIGKTWDFTWTFETSLCGREHLAKTTLCPECNKRTCKNTDVERVREIKVRGENFEHFNSDRRARRGFGGLRCKVVDTSHDIVEVNTSMVRHIMDNMPGVHTGYVITSCRTGAYSC